MLVDAYITREALASSRIEGTHASLSEVFRAAVTGGSAPDSEVQEVENYIRALKTGLVRLQELPLCLRLVREIHSVLMQGVRGREKSPGDFRVTQNWIGAYDATLATATFVPPAVEEMTIALNDWESFVSETPKIPLLIQCAILHYQFETIHPFLDGNGRLRRLLIVFFLTQRERLPQPLLYVSSYFETHRQQYYELLQGVRERGEWQLWIQFFLRAAL